ncbi:hypothetical protein PF011_g9578 [Phytophthora fragariae]|uniref:Uncharacterized protein n=1 Tax=Phytophthora fragariae TaxID=53985 RepID=A0A6A3KVW1_9STRA|nr:hypothetical protein PF011_g9578 [Phytophthora fragariae]
MHLNEADSSRLSLIAEEEAGNWRRRGKEEAWLKVRQLLIQEEAKATPLKIRAQDSRTIILLVMCVDGYDNIRLLGSLGRVGREEIPTPDVKFPPRTFVNGVESNESQFRQTKTTRESPNQICSVSRNQLSLLAMLGQITLA